MSGIQRVGGLLSLLCAAVSASCTGNMLADANDVRGRNVTVSASPMVISSLEHTFNKISMTNSSVGWGISEGKLFRTSDGGRTWEIQFEPKEERTELGHYKFEQQVENVQALSANEAWFSDSDSLLHTVDAGKTWSKTQFEDVIIRSFKFQNNIRGWVVGEKLSISEDLPNWLGYVAETEDGGKSWSEIKMGNNDRYLKPLYDLWVSKNESIFLIGYDILQSENGGREWQKRGIDCDFYGVPYIVHFFDEGSGFVLSNQGSNFCITKDGGDSWQTRHLPEIKGGTASMVQTGRNLYWAAGDDGIFRSIDDGNSWQKIADGKFAALQFLQSEHMLIAAGNRIIAFDLSDSP